MRGLLFAACLLLASLVSAPSALAAGRRAVCNSPQCQNQAAASVGRYPTGVVTRSQPKMAAVRQPLSCPDTCYGVNGCDCHLKPGGCDCHEVKAKRAVPTRSLRPAAARQSVPACQGEQCSQRRVGLFGRMFGRGN